MFLIKNSFKKVIKTNSVLCSIRHLSNSLKDDALVKGLQAIVGPTNVSTAEAVRHQHGKDEGPFPSIPPDIVVFAQNTGHVSAIHKLCYESDVPIIPFGTGTGLEGGVNAVNGGVCVDVSQMKSVVELNAQDFDCTVEAGIDWRTLNEYLRDTGLYFPVDPGASASIGGMASTCASGTNAVAFGTMKQNILNLEVVLPNGGVIHTSGKTCRSRKSSAGYDLTSLFVGSEGTLGTITKICLKLSAIPESVAFGVCSFPDDRSAIDSVIETLQSSINVARVEYVDSTSIDACHAYSKIDLPRQPTLFLEFNGNSSEELKQRADSVREIVLSNGGSNFECSSDPNQRKRIWKARHELYYACKALKPNSKAVITDVAVPISRLTEMILRTKQVIAAEEVVGPMFGHVGDGNFHAILVFDKDNKEEFIRVKRVANRMSEIAIELNGTCTGEHGIGRGKVQLLGDQFGADAIQLMKNLKLAIDPKNLMNPQKLF